MALTISLPTSVAAKSIGLEVWMGRVLAETGKIQPDWDPDDIHDLRVALRRSRTMADALSEVNPAPGWRKVKKFTRDLFHALGELRDTQIERHWIKKLMAPGHAVRRHMLRILSRREQEQRKSVRDALDRFDRKDWRRLSRKLASKARLFPLESVVFQRLGLLRLNDTVDLYQQACRRRSTVAWHRVRIAIKRFRYIVENFLPQRYQVWSDDLKHMQDLLGDVHDMDLLRKTIRQQAAKVDRTAIAQTLAKIEQVRKVRLGEFLSKTTNQDSPWVVWRAGFQWEHARIAASFPQRRTA